MKSLKRSAIWIFFLCLPVVLGAQQFNTAAIDTALGRTGSWSGSVYKVSFPRTDLHVTVRGVPIRPGLALGSWAAFSRHGNETITMGDLCLLPEEVNPVLVKLRAGGIELMALHNHLLFESPRVMYMHFMGEGNAGQLAQALRAGLAVSATPLGSAAAASAPAPPWAAELEKALGRSGTWHGGVLGVGVPRSAPVTVDGWTIPPAMGVAESMNIQDAGGGRVATTGDFVLTADEVNAVVSALAAGHIMVTAVHSHMLTEEPRLFFMHFWGVGTPAEIGAGLKGALAKIKLK
jgi:hypothetical protein